MFSVFRQPLTVRREGQGQFVNGLWQRGAPQTLTVTASVQPASPTDLEVLPEGRRGRKAFKVYTSSTLRESDQQNGGQPDRIRIAGQWYEVAHVQRWENNLINHHEVLVVRVDPEPANA